MLVEVGVHKWMCDKCGKIEYAKKVPEGWIILDRNFVRHEVEHLCKECQSNKGSL